MTSFRHVFVVGTLSVTSITTVIIFTLFQKSLVFEAQFHNPGLGWKNDFPKDIYVWKIQLERQKKLSQFCKMRKHTPLKNPGVNRLRGVLVDKEANVAYLPMAKVACTSWKIFFITRVTGNISYPKLHPHKRKFLKKMGVKTYDLTVKTAKKLFQHFKTFVFIRHPLVRLLSAYIDKMGLEKFQRRYMEDIYKKTNYRPPRSNGQNKTEIPIPFHAFVKYVIATQDHKDTFNSHWRPQILRLHPCQIHYDFIGKFETIQNDTRYVFKHFFHNTSLSLPRRNSASTKLNQLRTYKKSVKEYYAELTPKELEDIISVYSDDFEVFGYPRAVPE